jgi:MoaA/NifB/PqqE/SkfB family radical SAM enzyme
VTDSRISWFKCNMNRIGVRDVAAKASRMLLRRPTATEILWINFAVTYLCNSRCRMCHIWKRYRQDPSGIEQELSLAEIEGLLSSDHMRNVQGISLTGGEPFLRKDFVDLAGLCIQRFPNAFISIATNGLSPGLILHKTRDILRRFEPKLLSLSVSLDGIGDAHDIVRGVNGAYGTVLRTVKSLVEETNVNVGLDFTITPWNYDQVWNAYQLSKELGTKFIAVAAHNSGFYYGNAEMDLDCGDARGQAAGMVCEVAADRAQDESLFEKIVDPYVCFMTQAAQSRANQTAAHRCYSGTHSLFVDPYGNVYPCILLDKKIGNIRQVAFDELWLTSRAFEVREYIEQERCQCWVACETVPSMLRGLAVPRWNLVNKIVKPMLRGRVTDA